MKICAAVCEYNPFHNGHKLHLDYIKNVIKPDYTVIVMSGNFCERGDVAVLDKYARAKHAVLAGADAVIELPAVFACANAEVFASGAMKLIAALPGEKTLCFGAENDNLEAMVAAAKATLIETDEFKAILKQKLKDGESHIRARSYALEKTNPNVDFSFLEKPNNILGVEYIRAVLKNDYDINVHPIARSGAAFNDDDFDKQTPSALAIRTAIKSGNLSKIKRAVPPFVYKDLPKTLPNADKLIIYSLLSADKRKLKDVSDCTEGLENRIKALIKDNFTLDDLLEKLRTKRYTEARLKRILISCLLKIKKSLVFDALESDLYLKVLATRGGSDVLSVLSKSAYPLLTRKSDVNLLTGTAKKTFEQDVFSQDVYNLIVNARNNEYEMKIVEPE